MNSDHNDPYHVTIDDLINYAVDGLLPDLDTPLFKIPVKGDIAVDPFQVQFNGDPRMMGFEILDVSARMIAKKAKEALLAAAEAEKKRDAAETKAAGLARDLRFAEDFNRELCQHLPPVVVERILRGLNSRR